MSDLKDLLAKSIKKAGIERQVTSSLIVEKANKIILEIFGPKKAEQINAAWIKDNYLTIACLNASAASEVRLFEKKIISSINEYFGREAVSGIRYII